MQEVFNNGWKMKVKVTCLNQHMGGLRKKPVVHNV